LIDYSVADLGPIAWMPSKSWLYSTCQYEHTQ